jgi:hypothetical protein
MGRTFRSRLIAGILANGLVEGDPDTTAIESSNQTESDRGQALTATSGSKKKRGFHRED